jgi:hypothetical protein
MPWTIQGEKPNQMYFCFALNTFRISDFLLSCLSDVPFGCAFRTSRSLERNPDKMEFEIVAPIENDLLQETQSTELIAF